MRSTRALHFRPRARLYSRRWDGDHNALVRIEHQARFYPEFPTYDPVINPVVDLAVEGGFTIPSASFKVRQHVRERKAWAVIGANPTAFLNVLKGDYIAIPSSARTYPYLASEEIATSRPHLSVPARALQYVGFDNVDNARGASSGVQAAYMSARYESRVEETDWTLEQYLRGQTELNADAKLLEERQKYDKDVYKLIIEQFQLSPLLKMPVANLSNGQTRRARIAKAVLSQPECLLLDEPFMGLDPPTLTRLNSILHRLHQHGSPQVVLGLRPQDPIPSWINRILILGANGRALTQGKPSRALYRLFVLSQLTEDSAQDPRLARAAKSIREHYGPLPAATIRILEKSGTLATKGEGFRKIWEEEKELLIASKDSRYAVPWGDGIFANMVQRMPPEKRNGEEWWRLLRYTSDANNRRLETAFEASDSQDLTQKNRESLVINNPAVEPSPTRGESLIELNSIVVKYGNKTVLGFPPAQPGHREPGLNLTISRGTRMLLLGPNGSGKTTLLALLNSDHPHSYSLPIKFFGRTRLPEVGKPGLSLFEIQSRIGHSSPEVHHFFPRNFTVRRTLESAWAETFSSKPDLTPERNAMVKHFLRTWTPELCQLSDRHDEDLAWASDKENHPTFTRLPFGAQRLLLLLRAIIKQPDIVILDEALSGLTRTVRDKALKFLEGGDVALGTLMESKESVFPGLTTEQALIVVSHVKEEIPDSIDEYVRLPSPEEAAEGKSVQIGRTQKGWVKTEEGWSSVWGLQQIHRV